MAVIYACLACLMSVTECFVQVGFNVFNGALQAKASVTDSPGDTPSPGSQGSSPTQFEVNEAPKPASSGQGMVAVPAASPAPSPIKKNTAKKSTLLAQAAASQAVQSMGMGLAGLGLQDWSSEDLPKTLSSPEISSDEVSDTDTKPPAAAAAKPRSDSDDKSVPTSSAPSSESESEQELSPHDLPTPLEHDDESFDSMATPVNLAVLLSGFVLYLVSRICENDWMNAQSSCCLSLHIRLPLLK